MVKFFMVLKYDISFRICMRNRYGNVVRLEIYTLCLVQTFLCNWFELSYNLYAQDYGYPANVFSLLLTLTTLSLDTCKGIMKLKFYIYIYILTNFWDLKQPERDITLPPLYVWWTAKISAWDLEWPFAFHPHLWTGVLFCLLTAHTEVISCSTGCLMTPGPFPALISLLTLTCFCESYASQLSPVFAWVRLVI